MEGGKKILFISYDGMTDPLGQSQVIPYLIGLTKYGYQFTILSCDKPAQYNQNENYVYELIKGYPIIWVSIPYHKNPPVLSSVYDVKALKRKAKQLHKKHQFDIVHTRPGIPTLVGLWMKKKYRIKFLNDVRGFWADERVDGEMWNLKNPLFRSIYNFFKKHELECIEKADAITCLTSAAKKEIQSWKQIADQPIQVKVISCSADLKLFNPDDINFELKQRFKTELKITDNDFIVSYLGSVGGWYLTDEMMKFCKILLGKKPSTKFLFISPGRHEVIAEAAKKYNIPAEKIIVKQAKRHEIPALLSFSNYSLFFIKPCFSKISSSPTKHGEIMAMGIPVITSAGVGDVEEITNKANAGFVAKNLSEEDYKKIAEQIAAGKNFDSKEIRKGAKKFYSLDNAVKKYAEVYKLIFTK